ncbi:protein CNPPD1-like [Liolophura sinensis]|uniref:protein CNPPD1-like n=1 Tax=Liolophura sinensis TaxID=3198878 RepID=UPI003159360E
MASSVMFQMKGRKVHCRQDYDDHPDHVAITERLRKTLYFGKTPQFDRPSLPLTELAVEICQDAAQRELGRVDTYVASSMGRRACMSPCSMVLGLLYIERLKKKNPSYLRQVSSSDLFLISMMMASKYVYDEGVDEEVFNDEWAESARMEVDEVNDLEMDFLSAMDWGLFVRPEDFETVLQNIEKQIALGQGLARNWFSYTDLWVLFQDPKYQHHWAEIRKELSKVFIACSLTYIAGVLTMVGSVMALFYASAGISMVTPVLLPLFTAPIGHLALKPTSQVMLPRQDGVLLSGMAVDMDRLNSNLSEEDQPQQTLGSDDIMATMSSRNPRKPAELSMFSSVLPPFLAVVTLKNTLLNFVSAVSNPGADNPGTISQLSPFSCQPGVCNSHMKPNCWNLSNPDSSTASTSHKSCCGHDQQNFDANMKNNEKFRQTSTCLQTKLNKDSESTEFRCCCEKETGFLEALMVQRDIFPDISLGFQTRTLTPMVADT